MNLYCRYLTGKDADEKSAELFDRAIQGNPEQLGGEEKLIRFLIENRWSLGCVDAALGFFLPRHRVRCRMIIAFAILETNPRYFECFGPRRFSGWHAPLLVGKGVAEALKAGIGAIILRLV
jgi:hypothetical protein